jgi:hypothetical protein
MPFYGPAEWDPKLILAQISAVQVRARDGVIHPGWRLGGRHATRQGNIQLVGQAVNKTGR